MSRSEGSPRRENTKTGSTRWPTVLWRAEGLEETLVLCKDGFVGRVRKKHQSSERERDTTVPADVIVVIVAGGEVGGGSLVNQTVRSVVGEGLLVNQTAEEFSVVCVCVVYPAASASAACAISSSRTALEARGQRVSRGER